MAKRSFINDLKRIWIGPDDLFQDQVLQPLITGGPEKITFSPKDIEKVSIAVKCSKILADNIARIPIAIYKQNEDGTKTKLVNDLRNDLLTFTPDGMMTKYDFYTALEFTRNLRGNAFAKIIRNKFSGIPEKLQFLPADLIKRPNVKKIRGQLYYVFVYKDENGKKIKDVVNYMDMLHFKMTTKDGIWGLNPIEAQRLNLSTLYKSKTVQDKYYENNAFTPAFLTSEIPDSDYLDVFEDAMAKFKDKYTGTANAGSIAKLPPFTKIQQLDLNIIDAAFIASSKYDSAQIAAFYDVPPHMVGLDTGTYKNIEELTRNFATFGIGPIARMYKEELEFKLLTLDERKQGYTIEFDVKSLIELDSKTKLNYYNQLWKMGVITSNQIAIAENIPTFDGGDVHLIQGNNMIDINDVGKKFTNTINTDPSSNQN